MTIQSETRLSGPYTGTGLVTVYPFTFKVFQASDLLVIQTDTSGTNTTLALTSNYTVSLNPDQNSNPGGSITLVSALPASYTLVISSQIPYQQTLDILNNQTWYPQVIEDALDRLTILIQQVKQSLGNALQLPLSSSGVSTTLPNPVASNFLGWNSAANAIINYAGVASAAVSTYMSGFVSLTSAAAARAYIAAVGLADTNVWTATNTFTDTLFRILKNGSSFYARILATNLTANRDITLPDANFTMVGLELNQTFTGVNTFSSIPQGTGFTFEALQYFRLNADLAGANVTTAQSIFGVGVTLASSSVYEFEIKAIFTKTAGTTAHNVSLGFGGTATLNNILYEPLYSANNAAMPTGVAVNIGAINTASSTPLLSGLASATQTIMVIIKGTVSVNAGGTFIPQYTLSAAPGGAYSTVANSDMKISKRGASGANTSIGTWA